MRCSDIAWENGIDVNIIEFSFVLFSTFRWKRVRHILKSERRYQYRTLLFSFHMLCDFAVIFYDILLPISWLQRRLENNIEYGKKCEYSDPNQIYQKSPYIGCCINSFSVILLLPVKVAKLVTHCYSSHDFLIRQNGIKKRNIKGDSVMPFSKLANRKYAVFSLPYTQTHTSESHWQTNCRFQANFMLRIRKFNHYIYRYKRKPAPFVGAITAFQLSWGKSFEKIYYYQTHNFIGFKSRTYI